MARLAGISLALQYMMGKSIDAAGHFSVQLPEWALIEHAKLPTYIPVVEDRMRAVIRFSRLNLDQQTGGPFAAAVFERDSGRLVALGVNRVLASNMSSAHAEIVALSLAQQKLRNWNLGCQSLPAMQLVVNWRPCAMCYGATIWSGIRSLIIAGCDDACERITGFDEGPIHPEWRQELSKRGIELRSGLLYEEAIQVFEQFRARGEVVYNPR